MKIISKIGVAKAGTAVTKEAKVTGQKMTAAEFVDGGNDLVLG